MARAEHGTGRARDLAPCVDLAPPAPPVRHRREDRDPARAPVAPAATGDVVLRLPADPAYLAVLRTTAAALGARLDLTLEEVEDVRVAVDEAAALVLGRPPVRQEGALEVVFAVTSHRLAVTVHGPAASLPARDDVAWAVLEALAGEVDVVEVAQGSAVRLVHDVRTTAP